MKQTFENFIKKQHVDFGIEEVLGGAHIHLEAFVDNDGHCHLKATSPDGWFVREYLVRGNALKERTK